ncbi:hypothetical protein CIHG_10411 [Coccidioides immitis H538.4]|uniref:Uncharacterized protein n=1 Tax=Coccidioides immitis H538.4 TaxID=396776 RepID=A0A0J8S663_COCIT|nr:hypothetical protein CIHG_10411 [Coccidioides immitis H538.4]
MGRDYHEHSEKIWLQKQDYCIVAVYSSISVENQDMCINIFNQNLLLSEDETNVSSGILISTLKILDMSYICIHIFQLILLSPSWLKRDEVQGKTHIHHYRQMNKTTYIYHLVYRDVQIKSNILDQQAIQKSFNKLYEVQHDCMAMKFKKKHPRTMQHFHQDT